ncbi:serine hydrolase domain-containing protein [Ferdinandcohnia quinoae]|uniref:Beta-lactamase family protein n=1 Tax=Fredinandcohnia quinoae TaxID=2918902 RepID=A0AAW5EAP6_9BACI|nr:serine hydrolase domain-containing protein [Fredinandcohnia sp. SECRCQ15]MCH1626740.1 beta-lactamase family protein [Fredinandcohnia sp. SECRCQ15]
MKAIKLPKQIKKIGLLLSTIAIVFATLLCFEGNKTKADANDTNGEIDQYIQKKLEKNNIPGAAVAITHNDKVIFTKGYGRTSNHTPITEDTQFAIASLSKAFTALSVMQLVEEGKIDLDKPIKQYVPSFQLNDLRGSKITPRHLLNHTSGLTDKVYHDMTLDPQPKSFQEVIQQLRNVSLTSEPGKEYHYNNTNYQLLALLVEAVSNEEFSVYLKHHIFDPLEMKQTFNVVNTKELNKGNKVIGGHYYLFGQPIAKDEPEWFVDGPAGIVSSAKDMAKWLIIQSNEGKYDNNQLLSSKGIKKMHTPASSEISYGMGWNTFKDDNGKNQIQHSGILWTYKSEALLLPDERYGIVMLFNSGMNIFVDYYSFTDGIAKILTNQPQKEPFYNNQLFELLVGAIIIVTIILGIRQLLRLQRWAEKYKSRPRWLSTIYLLLRLIPLCLLIFLPKVMTFIGGGRVLSWEGIILMMPSIFILLIIASFFNLMIAIFRVKQIFR